MSIHNKLRYAAVRFLTERHSICYDVDVDFGEHERHGLVTRVAHTVDDGAEELTRTVAVDAEHSGMENEDIVVRNIFSFIVFNLQLFCSLEYRFVYFLSHRFARKPQLCSCSLCRTPYNRNEYILQLEIIFQKECITPVRNFVVQAGLKIMRDFFLLLWEIRIYNIF